MGTEKNQRDMEMETGEDAADLMFAKKRGCCFWIPCLGSDRSNSGGRGSVWWERIRTPDNDDYYCWSRNLNNNNAANKEEKWWKKGWDALLKVREWSEIVAGPRWKTFIRRFNKNNNNNRGGGVGWKSNAKFQYDPLSYALNFDQGPGENDHSDVDRLNRDFSSRYASIPITAKSSMDLGRNATHYFT